MKRRKSLAHSAMFLSLIGLTLASAHWKLTRGGMGAGMPQPEIATLRSIPKTCYTASSWIAGSRRSRPTLVAQGGSMVARTRTAEDGRFAFRLARGGTYELVPQIMYHDSGLDAGGTRRPKHRNRVGFCSRVSDAWSAGQNAIPFDQPVGRRWRCRCRDWRADSSWPITAKTAGRKLIGTKEKVTMTWARTIRAVLVSSATGGLVWPGNFWPASRSRRPRRRSVECQMCNSTRSGKLHGMVVDGQGHGQPAEVILSRVGDGPTTWR